MRFVATADWQLGMTARFLPPEARSRYHQARLDVVRRIGQVAVEHEAAFVLVAGDVFESNQLDRRVVVRALEAMSSIEVPVWLLPGNHDPLDAASIYTSALFARHRPENVRVLDRPGVHEVTGEVDVIAAPWFSKAPLSDLVGDALEGAGPGRGRHRILAGHGAVWTADDADPSAIDTERIERAATSGTIRLAVLGDRHSLTRVSDHIWYPGTPEVTDRREVDPGHVLVVELSEPLSLTPVRVGSWSFDVIEERLGGRDDVAALGERLAALDAKERRAVWLALTGTLTLADKARLDALLEEQADLFASLRRWERHTDLAVLPDDGDLGDLGLTGFAREAVAELVGRAEGGEDAVAARDALSLLYRLSGGGR